MNKIGSHKDGTIFMENVKKKYTIKYRLFVIIPFEKDDKYENKLISHNNIHFYFCSFPSIAVQMATHAHISDCPTLPYAQQWKDIGLVINSLFDFKNLSKWNN